MDGFYTFPLVRNVRLLSIDDGVSGGGAVPRPSDSAILADRPLSVTATIDGRLGRSPVTFYSAAVWPARGGHFWRYVVTDPDGVTAA